jgi:hypothetical protein
MATNVAGELSVVRVEVSECIYDSFREGESFTTREAVGVCKEECDCFSNLDNMVVWTRVFDILNWMVTIGTLRRTATGWRL